MPALDTRDKPPDDARIATLAEILYLVNLLLLPGLAFMALIYLYLQYRHRCSHLCHCHLSQTLSASLWGGALLVVVNAVLIVFIGYDQAATWVILIIYFTTLHATLVLLGVVGLARAMAGQHYHFPLIGTACPSEIKP